MAFPLTSILDSGAGADADPIGGAWTVGMWSEGNLKRLSNVIRASTNAFCSGTPTTTCGPYAELYATLAALPVAGNSAYLHVKADSIAATQAALHDYFFHVRPQDGFLELQRLDLGVGHVLTSGTFGAFTAGDSVGVQYLNGVLTGWYKAGAGAWTQKLTFTETTYQSQVGYGIIELPDSTVTITNVGGGTVQPLANPVLVKNQAVQQAAFF